MGVGLCCLPVLPWRWMQLVLTKCWHCTCPANYTLSHPSRMWFIIKWMKEMIIFLTCITSVFLNRKINENQEAILNTYV